MSSGFLPDLFSSSTSSTATGAGPGPINTTSNGNGLNIMYNRHGYLPDRSQSGFGKRTLAELQNQQFQQHNPLYLLRQQQQSGIGVGEFPMRSVKPRIYQNVSPISPLSPIDLLPEIGRYGVSQMRHQNTLGYGTGCVVPTPSGNVLYNQSMMIHGGVVGKRKEDAEAEKKMMMNRLHELEKQLLDDDNEVEDASGDSVSAITGNEWSETIRNLIGADQNIPPLSQPQPQQKQVNTSSPSSSSSSCSSTVASSPSICPKQSINEAATAIAEGKSESAAEIVARVAQSSNPRGSPEQRLAYYMILALKSKVNSVEGQKSYSEIRSEEHFKSVQLLYQHSRCFNLGLLAATLAIIEATADVKSLHVVDFDMGYGEHYQKLLHLLSLRKSGKPASIRITAVAVVQSGGGLVEEERSRIVMEKLSQLGERVGVPFELKILRLNVGDVNRESLRSSDDEALAVNLPYTLSKIPDESVSTENQRDELLRRVKGLNARIVTVVEEEMNCNTAPFQTRVAECCSFYGALLESMDSGTGRDDAERVRVEEGLGRRMRNSVACEGGERVERCEVSGKWRARMGMAGFELKPISQNVVDSLSSRFNNSVNSGPLSVKETNGGVCFGWMGRILTVTSAWR